MSGSGRPSGKVRRRWVTTVEAADYLGMSPRTLEGMRVDGTGPAYYKLGPGRQAKVVYTHNDLDEWVEQYQYRSTAEYVPLRRS